MSHVAAVSKTESIISSLALWGTFRHSTAQHSKPSPELSSSIDRSIHRAIEHHQHQHQQHHHQHIKQNEIQKQKAIKEPLERFVDFNDVCIGDDFPFRFWPCKTDTAQIRHLLDLSVCACVWVGYVNWCFKYL